jgi:hypothetical protein
MSPCPHESGGGYQIAGSPQAPVTTIALIRFVIPVARLLLLLWQMRWLLRAYRRERDRHRATDPSSRLQLLAAAVFVVAAVAFGAGASAVRPVATGGILIMSMYQAAQRRWLSGHPAAQT